MKKHIKPIICIAAVCVMLCGCSDELFLPHQSADSGMPIIIGASYPSLTRASDSGFDDGDIMGLYVLDYLDDDDTEVMGSADAHGNNVKYHFSLADNAWSAASTLYWTSESTPADIIAYYPFDATITNPESVLVSIGRRQDVTSVSSGLGDYEAADMLWAKATRVNPTADRVNLTFHHIMAGVRVQLAKGTGFTDSDWAEVSKTVLVSSVLPDATVNLATGAVAVSESSSAVSITPLEADGSWRAVVVPQTVEAGATLVSISVDGIPYQFAKTDSFTYSQGNLHTFTITVNRRSYDGTLEFVPADETIEPWIDSSEFRDGLIREYLVVDVPERGQLAEIIQSKGIVPEDVQNLKLTGLLNQNDFAYIRENFRNMEAINLYDADVYDDGHKQPNTLPERALSGLETLHHVVFPRNLNIIGTCAFTGSGLMGDMIIPEGVTKIGWDEEADDGAPGHWGGGDGVFAYCSSLTGELSLPSTLEFIERAAFYRTSLTGDLHIPENVTFIGSMAFDNTKFTGQLSLPENLQELGVGAFYCVPFSGDLVIPQGITKIRNFTFQGGNYSHLSLPEGLLEIGGQAFQNCGFRGELVLPSTLRRIDSEAFNGDQFSSIVFNDQLSYIGPRAFLNNSRLMGTITIPPGVKAISDYTFEGCSLIDEIVLHDEIDYIGAAAFLNCYNLSSIVCHNTEPPVVDFYSSPFDGVPKDNFTLQVPRESIDLYKQAEGWSEFKRIAEYSNFVCRPAKACALNTEKDFTLVLNADGLWTISSKPDWCSIYPTSGNGKTELHLTINEMSSGSDDRSESIVFSLTDTDFTTECVLSQYNYRYAENECVQLQQATVGNGIDLVFVGDGFDGAAISSGEYLELVNTQIDAFFGIEPYTTYRDRFNVYACISLSQECGVNTANNWRDTRFMTLYSASAQSLVIDEPDDVFDYVVQYTPVTGQSLSRSLVIMTLNSDEYSGVTELYSSGSAISVCPPSSEPYPMDTRGVVQHEACGHGFGKLAEERITQNRYATKGEIAEINECKNRGWYKNISVSSKMADVDWQHFIFDPRYSVAVDVYEGGYGVTRGVFRSELNSCMNYCIPYFNAISRQAIVNRILDYSGEGFSMEKFYALDTDSWGSSSVTSRSSAADSRPSASHYPVRIIKSKKY